MRIPLRNTTNRYGLISQAFHWLIVVLLLVQYRWGWQIFQADSFRVRLELVPQHKTLGMLVLALVLLRLLWRFFNRPPALPSGMPLWERRLAKAGHGLLYGLILAVPLTGWLYSSAAGLGDVWWGPVNFPSLVPDSEVLENWFGQFHQWLALTLGLMALLHVLAALRHQFLLKDNLMKRMLPPWFDRS